MKKLTKIILLAAAFLPLVNDGSIFFPTSASKAFFFKSLVLVLVLNFLISLILDKEVRRSSTEKVLTFLKNPLFISVLAFVSVLAISTIFAVDKYSAFWGNIQRGNGLSGAVFFLTFFLIALLTFQKKDWLWFFKLSILVTFILLAKGFLELISGVSRPPSYVGNPTFFAGYLLFSIFSAFILLGNTNNKAWKYLSITAIILSVIGIFITQTRGSILAIAAAILVILIQLAIRGNKFSYKNVSIKKLSIYILALIVVFSTIFIITKDSPVWQKIPGIARIANISTEDLSTRTRLFSLQYDLKILNPAISGIKKMAIGWGPDNYVLAFAKNYQLEHYKYEKAWFDQAHNEFLNVLVTNGIIGLITYLLIWFFFIKKILRDKELSLEKIGFTFYAVAFFVHLLFVFNQIVTIVPFFAVLAFSIFLSEDTSSQKEASGKKNAVPITIILALITVFLAFIIFKNDLPAYAQMKQYTSLRNSQQYSSQSEEANSIFEPFTFAQTVVRRDFLSNYQKRQDTRSSEEEASLNIAFSRAEEYKGRRPYDFRFIANLAGAYRVRANEIDSPELLQKSEDYIKYVIDLAPNRPNYQYQLAVNLMDQGRQEEAFSIVNAILTEDPQLADSYYYYSLLLWAQDKETNYEEAFEYFEKAFTIAPELFLDNKADIGSIYNELIIDFYQSRSGKQFLQTAQRMVENGHDQAEALMKIIEAVEQGVWPEISFK